MENLFSNGAKKSKLAKVAFVAAMVSAAALALSGCAPAGSGGSTSETIKIGYVHPATGAYAGFTDGDPYMLKVVREHYADGITIGGKTYKVEILDRDSGSDPAKAGELAQQLITQDKVDLLLSTSTPETTNPVIAQCEANQVPCLSAIAPWQAVVFGGGFSAEKPMKWSHHFFFGIEGFGDTDPHAWDQIATNKKVGVLWPNDADGQAFRDAKTGYAQLVKKYGYTVVDPGPFEDGNQDFTSIISKFKAADVQIIAGVPIPPDFATFWTQAKQQGFTPKVATVGKALFFPQLVPSLPNNIGQGLAFGTWWGPTFPFKSSWDGTTPDQWIKNFEASPEGKGLIWNQATAENYAMFELVDAALAKVTDPFNKAEVTKAFDSVNIMTLAGQIDFTGGPFPGIATIPTVVGQWQITNGKWEWVVVDNTNYPAVPVARKLLPLK
ncbi:ABC transporter substrate-binding protein [Rhodoluna sp.]|uniref:ABC transporter substrate-binding protein n=1 Tax=Rhodoluna sp. TaxID=1969481 RepID=UPI0025DDF991|nr:ABC transporter substrate-binding protein [Rhodoluna sp.]